LRLLALALGWLVLVVAVDLGVGLLVRDDPAATGPGGRFELPDLASGNRTHDQSAELAGTPAMADDEWADEYWDEYDELRFRSRPYLSFLVSDRAGATINVQHGVRRSYTIPGVAAEPSNEVWFFGGSTMWGVGQRDEHTIASEVARLAGEEGVALTAVNMGVMGHTLWEEVNHLVAALAERPAPRLIVFYDGGNELGVQFDAPSGQPTHFNHDQFAAPLAWQEDAVVEEPSLLAEYLEVSAVGKLLRRVAGVQTAGAQEIEDEQRAAATIYARARTVGTTIAEDAGATVRFFVQPVRGTDMEPFLEQAGPGSIDVSESLDHLAVDDVYLDSVHTNELGSRLVAAAVWPAVRSAFAAP
jgi:lysophospholipase L1-like esterase